MVPKLLLTLLAISFVQCVSCEEALDPIDFDPQLIETHFEAILALYNQFRDLDQETGDLSNYDPSKEFLENHIKPLKTKLKQFSASIKAVPEVINLQEIKTNQDLLVAEMANLEIKFTNLQADGEAKKDVVVAKIDALLATLKALEEKQKEGGEGLEKGLDKVYGSTFDPYGHHSLATQIEIEVLKMSIGIIKDLQGSLKQLREEAGIKSTEEEIEKMSKDEVVEELADRLVLKKNDGVTPSTWLSKMIRTIEDISEFFQAKLAETFEMVGEDYAKHTKKIEKYWNTLQEKVKELEDAQTSSTTSKDEL